MKTATSMKSVRPLGAKTGHDTLARRWARPSCDINGLFGGYQGDGAKTVIPAWAGAKLSFRLPAAMHPDKVARQFTDWFAAQAAQVGCRAEVAQLGEALPVAVPTDSPFMQAAARAIECVSNKSPALIREGATIPIVADLKQHLGLDTLLVGFGLNSDNLHSPNECFGLDRFELGIQTHLALLQEIGRM